MPFLAALQGSHWNRTWTPYAGMVVFEMYKTKNASLAVRVVFHGEALTILGCEDSKCSSKLLLAAGDALWLIVKPFV